MKLISLCSKGLPTSALAGPGLVGGTRVPLSGVLGLGGLLGFGGLLSFGVHPAEAAEDPIYKEIRVQQPVPEVMREWILSEHLELMGDDDGALRFLALEDQTTRMADAGLEFEIVVEDLARHYETKLELERAQSAGSGSGSVGASQASGGGNFGIFHTYDETVDALNALAAEFPEIVYGPFSIGQSHEGRDLWAIKISDNPEIDEDEGEVLFDGVHHAREIMTVEMLLSFSRYLCENYATDSVVEQLVNSREIYFVPIVNPDGFYYNEVTNPSGGGLWRKNRRNNDGSSCWGVDPNRNYDYEWVGTGSSTDPCSETYRGPAPNSEPEIQAHTAFMNSREFVVWQSYHSVAGMVLLPWGYTDDHTPDDLTLRTMATEMAAASGYQVGQPGEILYNVNGGAFDWGYGATNEHEKIFGFTTEIGGSGFWPLESERDGLIAENLPANLFLVQAAGSWLELGGLAVVDGDNQKLDAGETVDLVMTVANVGVVSDANGVTGMLSCNDPYVIINDAQSSAGTIPVGQEVTVSGDPFTIEVLPGCPLGRRVALRVDLIADSGLQISGIVEMEVGVLPSIVTLDFESDAGGWTMDPSHTATTGDFVRIDPNPTEFQPGDDTTEDPGVYAWITGQNSALGTDDVDGGVAATRSPAYDLSGYSSVVLELDYFFGQRDSGDDSGDFFKISLSNDGGSSYPVDLVSIGDQLSSGDWNSLEVEVENLLPLTSQMVLRVQAADGTATGDIVEAGIDELRFLEPVTANDSPSAPTLAAPADGSEDVPAPVVLTVNNAVDPEEDDLTYSFRVWSDPAQTQLVASVDGVTEGSMTTSWTVDAALVDGEEYYWRAFADDGTSRSLYMDVARFATNGATGVPGEPGDPGTLGSETALRLSAGPSPSAGDVLIRYYTPAAVHAEIGVYDARGRLVRTLPAARWAEGWNKVAWDGRSEGGERVSSGVYWVRLELPQEVRTVSVVRVD